MGILIVDAKMKAAIATLIERARAKPVTWDKLRAGAITTDTALLSLADRAPGVERPPSAHIMLGSYRVCFSIEEQPVGFVQHLSISARRPGTVPNVPLIDEIAGLFGFQSVDAILASPYGKMWLEEFDPGHHAVNIIQLLGAPKQEGHG
jgi:hypothetical protein